MLKKFKEMNTATLWLTLRDICNIMSRREYKDQTGDIMNADTFWLVMLSELQEELLNRLFDAYKVPDDGTGDIDDEDDDVDVNDPVYQELLRTM